MSTIKHVTHVALLVKDQQEALDWYTQKLDFVVRSDNPFPGGEGRWVTISPRDQDSLEIVLQPAEWGIDGSIEERQAMIGKAPGFVITTDDCHKMCAALAERGVKIASQPSEMPWGVSAVIEDLYGVRHNLLQPLEK